MEDLSKRCFLCMGKKNEDNVCPCCGEQEISQEPGLLPLGSILAGRYYVGKARSQNGEGVTYVAFDLRENRKCSVREFFPASLASRDADGQNVAVQSGSELVFRDCFDDFNALWSKLARLRGLTALIAVYDLFSENNTSYAVYEEAETRTLRDYLLANGVGYISWEQARILFMPVLSTLGTLHTSGVIHRGLDPDAFLMTEDGKLRITDFSIARARLCYGDLESDVTEGYAPLEIYNEKYEVGPWTDVYAFTAVLYRALVGSTPIAAPTRAQNDQMMIPAKFAEALPPYVINALINGMQIEPAARTRNVEQLRSNLSASPRAVNASAGVYRGEQRPPVRINDIYNRETRRAAGVNGGQTADAPRTAPAEPRPSRPAGEDERPSLKETVRGNMTPSAQALLEEQKKKAKTRKTLLIIMCCLLALAAVGLGVLVSGVLGSRGGTPDTTTTTLAETVLLPDFRGALYDTVATDSYYSQYFHFVKVEEYDASAQKGQILRQSIDPQTQVNRGQEVILYVSAGPRSMLVPDLTGKTYEEALAILTPEGLVPERAGKYNDGSHAPDTVAETFPPAGEQITQGEKITVILWSGLEETTEALTLPVIPTTPAAPQPTAPTTEPAAPVTSPFPAQ